MPGTFAHITLVDTLCEDADSLDRIDTLTPEIKSALMTFTNFCELGAVSPDYPYLSLLNGSAAGWANAMHYWNTADFIRHAVEYVSQRDYGHPDTQKCIAWVFGYVTHLVADLTIHPIVNSKVGSYEQNKTAHRLCEMHQDVYIFNKMGLGQITRAEYIRDSGVASCSGQEDRHKLDPAVASLWLHCLDGIPLNAAPYKPGAPGPSTPPNPDAWHRNFVTMIDKVAEEGSHLLPLSRHFAEEHGLVYPDLNRLQHTYIDSLLTPEGAAQHYDAIFGRAQAEVRAVWRQLGEALNQKTSELFALRNGDLDTGMDESGKLMFWEAIA